MGGAADRVKAYVTCVWKGKPDQSQVAYDEQSRMAVLLKQAGFTANIALVPGAGHAFINEPQDETISFSAQVAPRLLRFLKTAL